jgi:hypothetical protein
VRPRGSRAAEQRDELAPFQLIAAEEASENRDRNGSGSITGRGGAVLFACAAPTADLVTASCQGCCQAPNTSLVPVYDRITFFGNSALRIS